MDKKVINGKEIWVSKDILANLEVLEQTNKGGFATLNGYISSSNRTIPEVSNINFTSRYSYSNLLNKKLDAIKSINFDDVTLKGDKFDGLTLE